jgi:hypothetical protein
MTIIANGSSLRADANGYAKLATAGSSGDPVVADDGYIGVDVNDALPATLYIGPCAQGTRVVHSAGYDGFVRKHFGADFELDDEEADLTGGAAVTMRVVPRPFVFKSPRHTKRVRMIEVGAINDAQATIQVALRAAGALSPFQEITIAATDYDQLKTEQVMLEGDDKTPQVELVTTDRTRIALVGMTAEILRPPVG